MLIDGKSKLEQTATRTRTVSKDQLVPICVKLLRGRYIEYASDQGTSLDFIVFFQPPEPMLPTAAALAKARRQVGGRLDGGGLRCAGRRNQGGSRGRIAPPPLLGLILLDVVLPHTDCCRGSGSIRALKAVPVVKVQPGNCDA